MGQATIAYFVRPDDDYAPGAVAITASAEDPDYLATDLVSENPARPAKLTTTSGTWVLQFVAPIQPVAAMLIYQYLDASLAVSLEANSSDSWGAPPYSQSFIIPAKRKDGPSNQRWTNNVGLAIAGSPSYAYWRLNVSGTNSQEVAIGRLMLASAVYPVKLLASSGIDESDDAHNIEQPTDLGVETIFTVEGPRRSFSGVTPRTDNSSITVVDGASYLRQLQESANGRQYPFAFFPFGLSAEPWLVRFESAQRTRRHQSRDLQTWPFAVREVSRGLPFP